MWSLRAQEPCATSGTASARSRLGGAKLDDRTPDLYNRNDVADGRSPVSAQKARKTPRVSRSAKEDRGGELAASGAITYMFRGGD
jgi:hypothetical protein